MSVTGDGVAEHGQTPKHVWVTTSAGRFPGLLLEWVKTGDSWKGRVIWAQPYVVQQAVLAANQLEPIDVPPGG